MRFTEQEIEQEIQEYTSKPQAYSGPLGYPYDRLSARHFEILLYSVFKKDIENGVFDGLFDDVSLMTGVGEQGRDCHLSFCGNRTGLVQCKHSINPARRVNKPDVAREIIKFALHYLLDDSLISDPSSFTYYFVASTDFAGTAVDLLCDFNRRILEEDQFQMWVTRVIGEYQAFKELTFDAIRDELGKVLRSITVKKMNASDLDSKLTTYPELASHFFSVIRVVSLEDLQAVLHLTAEAAERSKKRELIVQMASPINSVATEAVRMLREYGWLQDGTLVGAELSGANLDGADLSNANLGEAILDGVKLRGARLARTNLQAATLRGSDLGDANLCGAMLKDADLAQANLQGAREWTDEQLAEVRSLAGAIMVSGKRYNGRFNLYGDLLAHLMRVGQTDQAMANFYGVSVENFEWGQKWNDFSQSPPLMYSPGLEEWHNLCENPEGPYDN